MAGTIRRRWIRPAAVACALGVFGAGSVAVATGAFAADGAAHHVVAKVDVVATDYDAFSNDDPCPVYHYDIRDVTVAESDPAVRREWAEICDDELTLTMSLDFEIGPDGYANVKAKGAILKEICALAVICTEPNPFDMKTNNFRIPPDGKQHKRTVTLDKSDEGWAQFSIFLTNSPR